MYRIFEYINSLGGQFTRSDLAKFFEKEGLDDKIIKRVEDTVKELKKQNTVKKLKLGYKLKDEYLTIKKKYFVVIKSRHDEIFKCDDLIKALQETNKQSRNKGGFYEIFEISGNKKTLLATYDSKYTNVDFLCTLGGMY